MNRKEVNYNLVNCIKEKLLGFYSIGNSLDKFYYYTEDVTSKLYYFNNYEVYIEEKLANIKSVDLLFKLFNIFNINLTEDEFSSLNDFALENINDLAEKEM